MAISRHRCGARRRRTRDLGPHRERDPEATPPRPADPLPTQAVQSRRAEGCDRRGDSSGASPGV